MSACERIGAGGGSLEAAALRRRGSLEVGKVPSPQPAAELVLVEVESLQEAVALQRAHGLLRQAEPLGDPVGVVARHEV